MKKKSKVIPKYKFGGINTKDKQNVKNFFGNTGALAVNTVGDAIGMNSNIIDYKGRSANEFNQVGNVTGGVAKAAAPMIATAFGGQLAGQAVSGLQGTVGTLSPQEQMTGYSNIGKKVYDDRYADSDKSAMIGQFAGMGVGLAGSLYNKSKGSTESANVPELKYGGQMKYAMGGMNMQPNAEVEGGGFDQNGNPIEGENTLNPDNTATQFKGATHKEGGIQTNLNPGTLILSDKVKWDGKSAAEHNKPYVRMIQRANKDLENSTLAKESKLSAHLNLMAATKASQAVYTKQEEIKQSKIDNYTKRLGGVQKHAMGGIQLPYYNTNNDGTPKYWAGGEFDEETPNFTPPAQSYQYGRANFLSNGQLNNTNPLAKQQLNYLNNQPSSFAPGVLGQNDSGNTPDNPYDLARFDTSMPDESQDADVVVPGSPVAEKDFGNVIEGYDPNTYGKVSVDDSKFSTGYLDKTNNPGSKPNWKDYAEKGLNFAAQNAGNLYNLSRYNKPEVEKYDRLQATYLDPTASLRDADIQSRRAEYNVRGASGGNAGTYLGNRVALNAQNVINKDRINKEYQNVNAGIANNIGQYNTELSRAEVIANAANRARYRSGKGEAISQIGKNYNQQVLDTKKGKMEDSMMQMLPKLVNDPSFMKFYEEYKKNNPNG